MDTEEIYKNIATLNEILWENRVLKPRIEDWLDNFKEAEEKNYALFLLSKCMYFGNSNIRALLRALYRDKFRAPILQEIRLNNGNTLDEDVIEKAYWERLKKTRFLGVGNPSESGVHLLYFFRQENHLPKKLFVNTDDLLENIDNPDTIKLRKDCQDVEHIIFLDDLCGSGSQVSKDTNVKRSVQNLRRLKNCPKISYLMLFGTSVGIEKVRTAKLKDTDINLFDEVETVIEFNDTYKCFSENSRYFTDEEFKQKARAMAYKYGKDLIAHTIDRDSIKPLTLEKRQEQIEHRALGFGDCQLLLSLHHNTPNNTLPIIWFDDDESLWTPIFKRYSKLYR